MDEPLLEPSATYLRIRAAFGAAVRARRRSAPRNRDSREGEPFGRDRDPVGIGQAVGALSDDLGWRPYLAQSTVVASWPEIVGEETARHAVPTGIEKGVLIVQCDSTAWATQLRLMRRHILDGIARDHPDATIDSITFRGPGAPSWRKGPRSVPGRGPRDTYG